jgi:Cu(I)/Ag(I) efflux system membrane protein CusA/SilA
MQRANRTLRIVVPITLAIIFLLLYMNFRSVPESLIVMLSVPFALVGGVWLLWALDYNLSVAVWVGLIALAGVASEIAVVLLVYLDEAFHRHEREGRLRNRTELLDAIREGAGERVRPVLMTATAVIAGLLPILWGGGTGATVMKRIAAPMVGGMVSATVLTLLVVPALYAVWREWQLRGGWERAGEARPIGSEDVAAATTGGD